MEPENAPELSRQQLLLGELQKRKGLERPPESQRLLLQGTGTCAWSLYCKHHLWVGQGMQKLPTVQHNEVELLRTASWCTLRSRITGPKWASLQTSVCLFSCARPHWNTGINQVFLGFWKGKRVWFSLLPTTFSKQSILFKNFITVQCSRRMSIHLLTGFLWWSCLPLLGDLLPLLDKPYKQ